ncbi:MAG: tRNA (adenosine(37)-N6)-dimethylallyltransferase MiaA [bacterium]|nr:tRNA (adenosine(37)-N6)-dimethylallyltransferase MiaA [bacterium]
MKQKLVAVAGPTASGKTRLAIEIAKRFDGEIVGADSMQIYKYMDIGTAKPTVEERAEVPHHMIDFLEPDVQYSVADYTERAHEVIAEIASRGKLPVMCGGTGLYINSVVDDVTFGEFETDYGLRAELQRIAETEGAQRLLDILGEFDAESAEKLHPNNLRRIIRAIEFYRTTGVTISKHQKMTKERESRYEPVMLSIAWDRQELYDRINRRVDIMLDEGLFNEVRGLMERGYTQRLNSMKGIGYKEVVDCIEGRMNYEETVELIKQSSRRYAKRQLTWFRKDTRIHWVSAENAVNEAVEFVKSKLD